MLLVAAAAIVVARQALDHAREAFTDDRPADLPAVTVDEERFGELMAEVTGFAQAVSQDQPAPPLELSQDEINLLINGHPDWAELKGRAYVTVEGEEIKGEISVALGEIGIPFMEGRYLNGSATFSVFLRDGLLHVYLRSLDVKGVPVPDQFLEAIRTENLAADATRDPDAQKVLGKLDSIEIVDGVVRITPKRIADTTAEDNNAA